jgi:high-affinity nickel-transport protein
MLGTALLAYGFGLRHAIDADHIAAIDNVTRKLMNDGKRPVAVGFFFALGHSLVVIIGSIGIALTTNALNHRFAALKAIGATIGTSVSAFFLLAIALLNVILLGEIYRSFQRVRRGQQCSNNPSLTQVSGNLLARFFRPLFRLIEASWQMLPLGFLFGMGFETATEIGLLGTSAAQASAGISMSIILMFPCLFTVGMLTLDATDGVLMLGVYGWALVKPVRKLYYNMIITLVSTLVAAVIGGIQALGLLGQKLNLAGPFWSLIETLNGGFGTLGYVIVAIFIGSWLISAAIYRAKGYDRVMTHV